MCQYWDSTLALKMKLTIATLFLMNLVAIHAVTDEKNDREALAVSMPKTSVKCGECPCVNPCSQQLPPPPPPPKTNQNCAPPPPRFYYFTGPGDQTTQAITPPPPRFTYIISGGPPWNLFHKDPLSLEIYNEAKSKPSTVLLGLLLLVIWGLLWGI